VTVLRIRGCGLPEGEPLDLYADGDRWTADPVARAELVAEGWLLPGLVDAHTIRGRRNRGIGWMRPCSAKTCMRTWMPG